MPPQQRIGILFGGRSVEHEVSILTAQQVMAAMPAHYTVVPLYIAKTGQWYTGDILQSLDAFRDVQTLTTQAEPVLLSVNTPQPGILTQRAPVPERRGLFGGRSAAPTPPTIAPLDVVLPLLHGTNGEDGTVQGLLELANIPYCGSDVAASAIAMDKALTKMVLRSAGIPVLPDVVCQRAEWERSPEQLTTQVAQLLHYPVFVKPVHLGSSIGVAYATDEASMRMALDVAFTYDTCVVIEPAQHDCIEINCAVLGDATAAQPSVCEQPISTGFLSYEDKYLQGNKQQGMKGAKRIIPAPIDNAVTQAIQRTAVQAFTALRCAGTARIDFLVLSDNTTYYVNEVNPIPGSLAFYLWEASGISFTALLERLIALAHQRHADKTRNVYTFETNVLQHHSTGIKK